MKERVIIIGAGAAGLMAANELADDFEIIVLEARKRVGGRIHTINSNDQIIEAGAEFIHGKLPLTMELLKKGNIAYVKTAGKMLRKKDNFFTEQHDMIEGWDELLKRMKKVGDDMPLDNFMEQEFGMPSQVEFRKQVSGYASGFDLADPSKVSVKALYKEWSGEQEEIFRIRRGYGAIVEYLKKEVEKKGCRILTSSRVTKIKWKKGFVEVLNPRGKTFAADKLLFTLPVSMVNNKKLRYSPSFDPSISSYSEAAKKMSMGNVIKVVFVFKERFWQKDLGFVFSLHDYFPTWWSQLPNTQKTLTGWTGGPKALELSGKSSIYIKNVALASLAAIFETNATLLKNKLIDAHVFDWQKDPYALGGYCYDLPGSDEARKVFAEPIKDTIFFAGEGYSSSGQPGTVEAAMQSGRQIAHRMIQLSSV